MSDQAQLSAYVLRPSDQEAAELIVIVIFVSILLPETFVKVLNNLEFYYIPLNIYIEEDAG